MAVKGLNSVIAKLRKMESDVSREVKEVVELTLGDIEMEAIAKAPGGGDVIRTEFGSQTQDQIARGRNWTPISQAIGYNVKPDGLSGSVFVESSAGSIAAWVEFGTGQSAKSYLSTVEPEWRSLAQRYYINGRGTIVNQPYLYPAFLKARIQFVKDLKEIVKKKR